LTALVHITALLSWRVPLVAWHTAAPEPSLHIGTVCMWPTLVRVDQALILVHASGVGVSMEPLLTLTIITSITVNTLCIDPTSSSILALIHILTAKCRVEWVNGVTLWTLTLVAPITINTGGHRSTNPWLLLTLVYIHTPSTELVLAIPRLAGTCVALSIIPALSVLPTHSQAVAAVKHTGSSRGMATVAIHAGAGVAAPSVGAGSMGSTQPRSGATLVMVNAGGGTV